MFASSSNGKASLVGNLPSFCVEKQDLEPNSHLTERRRSLVNHLGVSGISTTAKAFLYDQGRRLPTSTLRSTKPVGDEEKGLPNQQLLHPDSLTVGRIGSASFASPCHRDFDRRRVSSGNRRSSRKVSSSGFLNQNSNTVSSLTVTKICTALMLLCLSCVLITPMQADAIRPHTRAYITRTHQHARPIQTAGHHHHTAGGALGRIERGRKDGRAGVPSILSPSYHQGEQDGFYNEKRVTRNLGKDTVGEEGLIFSSHLIVKSHLPTMASKAEADDAKVSKALQTPKPEPPVLSSQGRSSRTSAPSPVLLSTSSSDSAALVTMPSDAAERVAEAIHFTHHDHHLHRHHREANNRGSKMHDVAFHDEIDQGDHHLHHSTTVMDEVEMARKENQSGLISELRAKSSWNYHLNQFVNDGFPFAEFDQAAASKGLGSVPNKEAGHRPSGPGHFRRLLGRLIKDSDL
ncbi:hypothetical protein IE53DRAFT_390592 [Violaceomyces palustris]|uniref:Uncharacterized protein n=1 Tax=Violaceomyces palustris TaxID=1673888 RepID=A0ACD0NN72_9BASI|nr:hypothetical protein IE53DRAFT_390592 [Violaceomyces palustris]